MARKIRHPKPSAAAGRSRLVVLGCALFFAILAMLPIILPALHLQVHPTAPQASYGVELMTAPRVPHPVRVPAMARPIAPNQPPATPPTTINVAREAATVAAEDKRLRTVLHSASRVFQPEVVSVRGSLPTLVLTAASNAYTAQTLVEYGAMVMLPHNAALLIDNVYVSTNAKLTLGGPALRTLYLDSGGGGFATIIGWGGNLRFAGTASHPMTILGWDRANNTSAADQGYGRPYIREVGGNMTFTDVRASWLGFWSGRTGGVAWTGLSGSPSTGGAVNSTFTDDTYGSFVSRGSGVTFRSDLFEYNQLDGLHVHRYSTHTSAIFSSAVRNGANGFIVSPASNDTLLENDIAEHNGANGFFLNGRPLATGASASGGSVALSTGTAVEYSAALDNAKIGMLVEGGLKTVVKGDQVCGGVTAIEVKDGASDAVVTGNTVSCAPRSGISIGPSAPGTVLSGNAVNGARTAFLIRNSGSIQFDRNLVTNATVFGVSARGATSAVSGVGNTISGSGFRAIDSRADAPDPSLYGSNLSGWVYHSRVTFWSYLQFHPLAAMWLGIVTLLVLAFLWTRVLSKRRGLSHPYPQSTRWRPESTPVAAATADLQPVPAAAGPSRYSQPPPPESPAAADGRWASFEPKPAFYPVYDPPSASPAAGRRGPLPPVFGSPDGGHAPGDRDRQPVLGQTGKAAQPAGHAGAAAPEHRDARRDGGSHPPWDTMPMPALDRTEWERGAFDAFPPLDQHHHRDPSAGGDQDHGADPR